MFVPEIPSRVAELDPEQPRLAVPWLARLRHYGGLRGTLPRLQRLLHEFRFTSIETTMAGSQRTGASRTVLA